MDSLLFGLLLYSVWASASLRRETMITISSFQLTLSTWVLCWRIQEHKIQAKYKHLNTNTNIHIHYKYKIMQTQFEYIMKKFSRIRLVRCYVISIVLTISIDRLIATNDCLQNDDQLQGSHYKWLLFSHRVWYLNTFRVYAALRFSEWLYEVAMLIISRDPDTWSSTSDFSRDSS
jgi:hypothetical protein